jgi:dipeptidyl aminopeptidase/acylaminoacyl peptidase
MKRAYLLFGFLLCLCVLSATAQQLTVREIMAEPSIAGMRVEGEKLSPDGSKVVYLWNAEGKMPRDLYLVSTSGGAAQKILSVSDLPVPSRTPEKETKLDYGLVLRDDFAKARENQLGNFEWSPDSKKLVFSYGGDLYIFALSLNEVGADRSIRWTNLKSALERRSDVVIRLIDLRGILEPGDREFDMWMVTNERRLRNLLGNGEPTSIQAVLDLDRKLEAAFEKEFGSTEPTIEILRNNKQFTDVLAELAGARNRVKVARVDYESSLARGRPVRLTQTQTPETGARFLDNRRILYSQNGNLFVWNLTNNLITQISKEANQQNFIAVTNATPNKAGSLVAYVVSDNSKQKALIVPNYLGEFVAAGGPRRGWSEQKVLVTVADGSRETPFEVKLPKPEGVGNIRSLKWVSDGSSLIVDRIDKDLKRRQLFYIHDVGSKGEQIILVTEETDDKWQAPLSGIVEPNPKNESELFFTSERDGFSHLYLARLEAVTRAVPSVPAGGEQVAASSEPTYLTGKVSITQLTRGNWQVEWAKWLPNGDDIVFNSTELNSTERRFFVYSTGKNSYQQLRAGMDNGMAVSPQMDDQNARPTLLFSISRWDVPDDLYAQKVCIGCDPLNSPIRLTDTIMQVFAKQRWNAPKFIDITSRDGKQIKSKIYLPAGFNKSKKYPMVIFVHGAGYLQNTINGWNNYYREFMFNELLAQKGYVVLDIDYRGSAGYGREWRTDVYDFLGGKDYDDHLDAIDFMIKNYAVDAKRVGVYGGSYGGFIAEMLAFRAPEKIAAAAALRPVADWKNYYASSPGYTAQRLGFPDKNPDAYKRSSPITYADGLKTHLLILHGMSDDNVHVQDSIQLIEKLIRLGKTEYFESMLYPSENHGFVRPESWTDEYERILAFFEKHLKG